VFTKRRLKKGKKNENSENTGLRNWLKSWVHSSQYSHSTDRISLPSKLRKFRMLLTFNWKHYHKKIQVHLASFHGTCLSEYIKAYLRDGDIIKQEGCANVHWRHVRPKCRVDVWSCPVENLKSVFFKTKIFNSGSLLRQCSQFTMHIRKQQDRSYNWDKWENLPRIEFEIQRYHEVVHCLRSTKYSISYPCDPMFCLYTVWQWF